MHNDRQLTAGSRQLILGIDTSTSILDVAIFDESGEVLASEISDNERTHSERVMLAVDSVMAKAKLKLADIDVFACCTGSGSYTGVRIGVATAKGLALATGKEVKGISSFMLMSHKAVRSEKLGVSIFIPIIDARRGAVFAAAYKLSTVNSQLSTVMEPQRIDLEELKARFAGQDYQLIEPHGGKWQGVTMDMLGGVDIVYLGGSV